MQLYIYYKNKSAGIDYPGRNAFLARKASSDYTIYFVQMDKGVIAFTNGSTRIGGRPVNPRGRIGRQLLKLADAWINNPETIWRRQGYWHALFHSRKYPPFKYNR